jgi:hypothetical protein
MSVDKTKATEDMKRKEWEKTIKNWSENFRAADYVPNSGATRVVASTTKPKNKNTSRQWGW